MQSEQEVSFGMGEMMMIATFLFFLYNLVKGYFVSSDIQVYIKGVCKDEGKTGAKAGFAVFFGERESKNIVGRVSGVQSQKAAEFTAICHALRYAVKHIRSSKKDLHYVINIDSETTVETLLKCKEKWENSEWKGSETKKLENQALINDCLEYLSQINDTMSSVKFNAIGKNKNIDKAEKMADNACNY